MRKNNKFIIIISIILVLAIAGGVFAYLFLATDVFKSNRELFAKYFEQDLEKIENMLELDTLKTYQRLNDEKKYESNTNVKLIHSEGGEISNPLNNLSVKLDFQRDNEQQYFYGNGQISYLNETYLATELIKDQEQYGIRFSEAFKQFVTINQDEDIETIADNIGIDASVVEKIIQLMNGTDGIVSEEKIKASKDKYLNIITSEISKGTFGKQKNAMITYNDVTTKTNAYSVSLTSEQVGRILEEISKGITENIEVSEGKITVYEKKGQTIRTVIEFAENKIIIENIQKEEESITKINYSNLNNEEINEYRLEITKNNNVTNQENFKIIANILVGETEYETSLLSEMQIKEDIINWDLEINYNEDITTISAILENRVKISNDLKKREALNESNFKSLSSIKDEMKRKQIVDSLKQIVVQQTTGKIAVLMEKLMVNQEQSEGQNEETAANGASQAEINNFNAKFEFYAGEEVSSDNVKVLLDIIKRNCNGHEIVKDEPTEEMENTETEQEKSKTAIRLYIEEGATKEESIQEALKLINDNKKYQILITYKENNGLIDYITITEI